MTRKRKIILGIGIGVTVCVVAIIIVCMISPKSRRTLFGLGHRVAPDIFVDRLRGKAYSKSDYDGIDVSKHQGVIKWEEVAKDKKIKFVYIRATMGKGHKDKRYERNIREAKKAGLKVGSYHFMTSKFSVDEQFRSFLAVAKPAEQDLIPMVDVESGYFKGWSRKQLQDSLVRFSSLVKKHYGRRPMIYSSVGYYNRNLAPRFNDHIIYIASYSRYMPILKGDHNHNLWQYSEYGHIRGIGEYVDLCRFTNGTTVDDILLKGSSNIRK